MQYYIISHTHYTSHTETLIHNYVRNNYYDLFSICMKMYNYSINPRLRTNGVLQMTIC